MDNEVLSKINNLTNGKYAQEYFSSLGLNYSDAKKIRENLINNLNNEDIEDSLIQLQLYLEISKYCYDNKLTDNYEKEITNSYDEKLLIYKINDNQSHISCSKCKKELIKDFKYCPFCGSENIQVTLKIVVDGAIDLDKGFITPEEVKHIRYLTPNEEKLVKEGKVKFEDVGITLDENNSPYEIKNQLISKNENLRTNKNLREKLFNQNLTIHKKQILNYQLALFDDLNKNRNLKYYPLSLIEQKVTEITPNETEPNKDTPLVKPEEKRKKYIKIISKPAKSKTKEKAKEIKEYHDSQKNENLQPVDNLKINLKYAEVLYLLDAIKHPKNPEIPDNMLYWLNVSSKSEVTRYLRCNGYIMDSKGMDLIKANLMELSKNDLKRIMTENNLKIKNNKEDNVQAICDNVQRNKLEEYNKDSAIIITKKGYDFIKQNPQVEIYSKYLYNFNLKKFEQFYQENKNKSLKDISIDYLTTIRDYYIEKMKWNKFAMTFEAESRIYKSQKNKIMQLQSYINYFICMINPWKDNKLEYDNPIIIEDNEELIKTVDQSKLSLKEIQELFVKQSKEIKLPGLFLSPDDIYEYFIRIYNNEDLRKINKELTHIVNISSLESNSLEFFSKKEENEVYLRVKKRIN